MKKLEGILILIFWCIPYIVLALLVSSYFDYKEAVFWIALGLLLFGLLCFLMASFIPDKKKE